MRILYLILPLMVSLTGCALIQLTNQSVKTIGTVVTTTGKITETTGKIIIMGGETAGKVAEAGAKSAETAINTPGAKEVISYKVIP